MRKANVIMKLGTWKGIPRFIFVLGSLALLVSIATLSKSYSLRTFVISDTFNNFNNPMSDDSTEREMKSTLETVIQKIQQEINDTRDFPEESAHRYNAFLADILGLVELVQKSLPE